MLRRFALLACAAALLLVSIPSAARGAPAVQDASRTDATRAADSWFVIQIGDQDAGYAKVTVADVDEDGARYVDTTTTTRLVVKRMGKSIEVTTLSTARENAAGQIVALHEVQELAGTNSYYDGKVVDDELVYTVKTTGAPRAFTTDWPEDSPGPEEMKRRLLATGLREGASFTSWQFQFALGDPKEMTLEVGPVEEVDVDGHKESLHRTVQRLPGFPETLTWVDDAGEPRATLLSIMGIEMKTFAVDKERVASFLDGSNEGAEMFVQSMIRANVRLPRPRSLDKIVYEVRPVAPDGSRSTGKPGKTGDSRDTGDDLPDLNDERQTFGPPRPNGPNGAHTLEIVRRVPNEPVRQTLPITDPPEALREFLAPDALLQSDDPAVMQLAHEGIGDAHDPWTAAQRLERVVYETITKKSLDVVFASAAEVCATKEGDCSEHAVLLAALCRAVGIPSRVAMGIVYVGGVFGGHAWTEVQIDGTWYALDGTIGLGSVDPTHIRFGASSLKGGSMGDALLGVASALGRIDLRIVSFTRGDLEVDAQDIQHPMSIEDGVFHDRVEGVTFTLPPGFEAKSARTDILEMSNTYAIAHLESSTGGTNGTGGTDSKRATIDLRAEGLPPTANDKSIARRLSATNGETHGQLERETLGARTWFVLRGEGTLLAATREGDTLYIVEGHGLGEGGMAAVDGVLESFGV